MSVLVIGIAGGTGSGKSTIAKKIAAMLPENGAALLEYDAYYHDFSALPLEERARLNFDHPDALESALLAAHLASLKAGRDIEVPIYDFKAYRRLPETRRVAAAPVVIVEGILLFVEERLRALMDIKIFVDTDADIRVFRRIRRDLEHRGRTFESVREQYYHSVRPMHLQFVEPSKRWADLIIPEGGDNRVALEVLAARLRS